MVKFIRTKLKVFSVMAESASWKDSLRNLKNLARQLSEPRYRFDLPYVTVSAIAEQYYCESKVDLEYMFGEVLTEDKEEGRRVHEELLRMEPTTLEGLIKSIEEKPLYVCRFPVYAELEGLVIIGIPDAIVFRHAKPIMLLELKTTSGSLGKLWADERVQVEAYAYALECMGFDCGDLRLVVVKVKRSKEETPSTLLETIIQVIYLKSRDLDSIERIRRTTGAFRIHVLPYNRQSVVGKLQWARDYWLMRRDPIPTKRAGKCRACVYSDRCPYSLSRS